MRKIEKSISDIIVSDIKRYPIWEYFYDDIRCYDESWVRPVEKIPVDALDNRIIGIQVRLANDEYHWAIIEDIYLENEILTRHLISLDIFYHDKWFPLSTHGIDYHRYGPQQFADFLGLPMDKVFPISYDFTNLVSYSNSQTIGKIQKEPIERLSHDEISRMINDHLNKTI
jgi:hypothetical protein